MAEDGELKPVPTGKDAGKMFEGRHIDHSWPPSPSESVDNRSRLRKS